MPRSVLIMLLCAALLATCCRAQGASKAYPPGWNGEARTPPQGWRSWNAFGNRITQDMMVSAVDAATAKNRTVKGWPGKVSLCDLGYCSVGVDEGWEGCGAPGVVPPMRQHYPNGTPSINAKFPDLGELVDYGHKKGLKMGFYQNGCACGEHVEKVIDYQGDIDMLEKFNFDAVKLDGCGAQRNMTLYAQLMKATGRNYSIENCHWGRCTPSDDSSCPTTEWCPFNWYRSSGDINSGATSWYSNLQTTIRFQSWEAPVSQPSCWAYPDMLEVGRVAGTLQWNRAHFGAWCVVSAPLILGLELTDAKLDPILDIIGNKKALSVNQAWAGHPGSLVRTLPPAPTPTPPPPAPGSYATGVKCDATDVTQQKWSISGGLIKHLDLCLDSKVSNELRLNKCDGSKGQTFTADTKVKGRYTVNGGKGCLDIFGSNTCMPVVDRRVDIYACNSGKNQHFTLDAAKGTITSACGECLAARETAPGGGGGGATPAQLWAKPIGGGAVAALFINGGKGKRSATISLKELNITSAEATVEDVWSEMSDGKTSAGDFKLTDVASEDSAFLIFTPTKR